MRSLLRNPGQQSQPEKIIFLYTCKCILGVFKLYIVKQWDHYWETLANKANQKNIILIYLQMYFGSIQALYSQTVRSLLRNPWSAKPTRKMIFLCTCKCILAVFKPHIVKQWDHYWEPLARKMIFLYFCKCIFCRGFYPVNLTFSWQNCVFKWTHSLPTTTNNKLLETFPLLGIILLL